MDAQALVQLLGGTAETARFFGIRQAAVSQWKQRNEVPPARVWQLRALRPDLLAQLEHRQVAKNEANQDDQRTQPESVDRVQQE
ncbi:MAG: hypothetical protein KDI44_02495 [Thiothrix sp.]|nr:hypothetical protein [Thiothrix sp.]